MYYKVERNAKLLVLQKKLASKLIPHKILVKVPKNIIKEKFLYDSFIKYGFPFVGEHWIPHFTVASLQTGKNNPIIKNFLAQKIKFNFIIDQLSLWRINGDDHHFINNIYFK